MLEEYDALAAESASEEDENAAGLEFGAGTSWVYGLADLIVDYLADAPGDKVRISRPLGKAPLCTPTT